MKRRTFLAWLGLAPAAPAAKALPVPRPPYLGYEMPGVRVLAASGVFSRGTKAFTTVGYGTPEERIVYLDDEQYAAGDEGSK